MTELSFAKSFLTTLDQRPSKITSEHIEDPKNYPAQNAYILPRMPNPPTKSTTTSPSSPTTQTPPPSTYTIHLLSTRNPPLNLTLPSLPPTTSIHEIKTLLSTQTHIPISKLKILLNKKPVGDTKILKDFNEAKDGKLEFGVMVIGGAASVMAPVTGDVEAQKVVAQGISGLEVIESEEFWGDLRGFLMQRVRDEERSLKLVEVFREGFERRKGEF